MKATLHFLPSLLLALAIGSANAANQSPALIQATYELPARIFFAPSDGDKLSPLAPRPGVLLVTGAGTDPGSPLFNVQEFLKSAGVEFPAGAEAFYLRNGLLSIRNTRENIDLFEALISPIHSPMPDLQQRIALVLMDKPKSPFAKIPSFDELRLAAGSSWREFVSIELVSQSGIVTRTTRIQGDKPVTLEKGDNQAPDLPGGTLGSSCAMEPILGPDGITLDSQISFRHRSFSEERKAYSDFRYDGTVTVMDGQPKVLQMFTFGDNEPAYALVLVVNVKLPPDIKIQKATP